MFILFSNYTYYSMGKQKIYTDNKEARKIDIFKIIRIKPSKTFGFFTLTYFAKCIVHYVTIQS